MGINFQINIFVLEGLNILYLVQETFLHQHIEIFWRTLKVKESHTGYVSLFCLFQQLFTNKENYMKTRERNIFGDGNANNFFGSILEYFH